MWEFDGELDFAWVMGGLARQFGSEYRDDDGSIGSGPDCFADLMSHWLNVAGRTGMPCDPRLWTASPIAGTYPACIAAEAASEQGWEAGKLSHTEGRERLSFPSAVFIAEYGERHGVWGFQPPDAYRGRPWPRELARSTPPRWRRWTRSSASDRLPPARRRSSPRALVPLSAPTSGASPPSAACARPERSPG
jgi:hypothetical protein